MGGPAMYSFVQNNSYLDELESQKEEGIHDFFSLFFWKVEIAALLLKSLLVICDILVSFLNYDLLVSLDQIS